MANLAGDGIALQMAQSAWGADDEIMGHTKEKTVFDDARAGTEFGRQFSGIGDRTEVAVVDDVAFVGDESVAVRFDPENGAAAELFEEKSLGFRAERDDFDGQRMPRAQLR